MIRKSRVLSVLLIITLLMSLIPSAFANGSDSYTGTAVNELTDGDYIIVDRYGSSYDYYALGNSTGGSSGSGYGFSGVDVTVSGDTATVTDNAAVWTWNSSNNSFYNAASGKYLNLPSSAYSSGSFFSSSPVALAFYSINSNEATVYVPSGNGGYYLHAAYPSNGKAFSSSYARYMNSSYLSSGEGVYFYKVDSTTPSTDPPTEPTTEPTTTPTVSPSGSPESPNHVKSIEPNSGSDDNYTIHLNVTGKDVTTTETSTTPGQTVTRGTNLVIVIDVSGSIVGKEDALNNAIKNLVRGLPANSQVGVVTFNDSATEGSIYNASTINELSFSGVNDAGTYMARGIGAATTLLEGNGWSKTDNDKAMVIISDFDADDYTDSINNAKTAKDKGTKIYSVKVDSATVGAADRTELTSDDRAGSIPPFTRYVSSQYPSASAENKSMFGMFNQASVTPGTADTSATYVYGAGGGKWSDIFSDIKETQGITTTTTTTARTKGVEIQDVLSENVKLSKTTETNYGITVTAESGAAPGFSVDLSTDKKTVTVKFNPDFELKDSVKYTVNIPVEPTETAQYKANDSDDPTTLELPTNDGATLTYQYGDENPETVPYKQEPTITLEKKPYARLVGYTLSLKGDISLNFYIELGSREAADPEAYVSFDMPGTNKTDATVRVNPSRTRTIGGRLCYVFPAGIAAKEMTGEIKARFVTSDGLKSAVYPGTVQDYCEYIIDHSRDYDETTVALAKAIENYGAYSQEYFNYKTNDLANANRTEDEKELKEVDVSSIDDPVKSGTCTGFKYRGTTAMLTTRTGLRHYFKLDGEAADYVFEADGKTLDVRKSDTGTYVLIDDIWAMDLDKQITLTVTNKNDNTSFQLSYSVYNYIKQILKSTKTADKTKNAVRALHAYGEAAKAYVAAHSGS